MTNARENLYDFIEKSSILLQSKAQDVIECCGEATETEWKEHGSRLRELAACLIMLTNVAATTAADDEEAGSDPD